MVKFKKFLYPLLAILVLLIGCDTNSANEPVPDFPSKTPYQTRNVIIVVIDGPRFSESWGDPTKSNIPHFANELAAVGIHHNRFYNRGATYTTSGHAALTTGVYQWMANDGSEIPLHPSIFQVWLRESKRASNKVQIIASKEKLAVLADCASPDWRGRYNPMVNAADRDDHATLQAALQVMKTHHPNLAMIHFRGPDYYGHANDWENYIKSISETDDYTHQIWQFVQNDPDYKDATTLIVTNDHGRHNDEVRDGFVSHGDFCEGCMHINFYASGPDFKENLVLNEPRQSVDIASTVAELMNFNYTPSSGTVMWELFDKQP